MKPLSLQVDEWGSFAQQTLWRWLLGEKMTAQALGWPQQSPRILCRLAEGLAWGMISRPQRFLFSLPFGGTSAELVSPDEVTLAALRPLQIYWVYTNALHWMVDWPDRFREFLQLYGPQGNVSEHSLDRFYLDWISRRWNSPGFDFIHRAIQRFWRDRADFVAAGDGSPVSVEQMFAYVRLEEAIQISGVPEPALMRLAQIDILHIYSSNWSTYFLRNEVRQLQKGWGGWLSLRDAALWMGISTATIVRLSQTAILTTRLQVTSGAREELLVSRGSVARLLSRIENLATSTYFVRCELWSLQQVVDDLSCLGLDEAFVLEEVFHRRLRAYRLEEFQDAWDVTTIFFRTTIVTQLAERILEQRGWLSSRKAAHQMEVESEEIEQWVSLGILKHTTTYHKKLYLCQQEFDLFKSQFVTCLQAASTLGVSWRKLTQYIQQTGWDLITIRGVDDSPLYLLPRECLADLARMLEPSQHR